MLYYSETYVESLFLYLLISDSFFGGIFNVLPRALKIYVIIIRIVRSSNSWLKCRH